MTVDTRAQPVDASPAVAAAAQAGPAGVDRTPPQDLGAEQCVLGGMLLSKDAIADVVEILAAQDFYRPHHAVIFDVILDLYGRGEPADAITVAAALADAGKLSRVGGAPYLHTLLAAVPTAANAAYYARIVAERAVLRRLVEAGTRIAQLGYGASAGTGHDVGDIVDLAQQAVYDVTLRRVSEDFAVLADVLQPTLDEIEAAGAHGGLMTGLPTGFADLDRLLNGLHPGQLVVVAGRPGLGKALALDTPLPTPAGWTTMGQVEVGDRLIGADGYPTTVVATSGVSHGRPCYEVRFSDGSIIIADGQHRWLTRDPAERHAQAPGTVRSTEQIRATLRANGGGAGRVTRPAPNHSVDTCAPLVLSDRDLPVPPYTMGVWLGSGAPAGDWWPADPDIALHVAGEVRPSDLPARLAAAAMRDMSRIPAPYLRASAAQRHALVAGLLDAAGSTGRCGTVRLRLANPRLAAAAGELLASLGYPFVTSVQPAGPARARAGQPGATYTLSFHAGEDVFRCERKRRAHKQRQPAGGPPTAHRRYIVAVRPTESVPVRCVTVDNASHLYLAGRAMIPTHNSTAAMDFARAASIRHNAATAIFSLEMSKVEIVMRLLAAEARVPLHVLRSGQLSDTDWTKLARRMGEISEAPLFVDDTANMSLLEIRSKARRLRQRHDLRLIVVDYLQLMTSPKRVESRQQEVSELSRGLKLLAKEVEVPVVAVSQLNRGPEQRSDKRPQLSDLRESGGIENDADVVILIHRDDYYDKESHRAGEADFIVAKHRNGPTDTITVAAQLHLARFVDMAVLDAA